jgi:hypothetical protein
MPRLPRGNCLRARFLGVQAMTSKREILDTEAMLGRLQSLGITRDDAAVLRRISMTLHSWHELECGNEQGHIERDGPDGDGKPRFIPSWSRGNASRGYAIPDREAGALKRLKAIMARYPTLGYYVQGDPRGAALYILRPGDVPDGADPNAYYSRGIAVYR